MHLLHLGPALVLGLLSLRLTIALPTQDQHTPGSTASGVSASTSSVSESANTDESVVLAGIPKLTPDNTCGNAGSGKNKGYACDPKRVGGGGCCSEYGNCGNGPSYCGKGCQTPFGKCDNAAGPKPLTPEPEPSKSAAGSSPAPHSSAPAEPNPKEFNCGPAFGNHRCLHDLCCSEVGYCGNSSAYCSVPQKCQKAFGRCDSDAIPLGGNTSTDARPLVGDVSYDHRIEHCLRKRTIALTFDDGPSEHTSHLLDRLRDLKAKATFFIGGNNNGKGEIDTTKEWFDLVRRMVAEGHQVASHTFNHVRLSKISSELRKIEMLKNERAIANCIGKYPTYLRAPYTDCTSESGCLADMKALGYHLVHYDLTTEDYLHPGRDEIQQSKDLFKDALAKAPEDGNLLTLQHDIIPQSSGNLTELILQLIQEKGWEAVTVGTCMNDPVENWYREPSWISPSTAPKDACIVSRGTFCGTIPAFHDKASCFKSAGECMMQVNECPTSEGADEGGCIKFANICRLEVAFCASCGGDGRRPCERKHFEYKIE